VRLRSAILVGVSLVVAAVMVAMVWSLSTLVRSEARQQLVDELERNRQVFEELQAYRQSLFRQEIRVVAEEPRLKAVAATEEITHETVLGVARELRRAIASELFLITDGEGRLLADVAEAEASGGDLSGLPLVAQALARGEAEGVWTEARAAYQVQAKRLAFGTTPVGVLVIGHRLDDRVAQTVRRQTGSTVVVLLEGEVLASSSLEGGRRLEAQQAAQVAALRPRAGEQVEIELLGERYLASGAPFPGHAGERDLRYVVLRSLAHAEALRHDLVEAVYVVAALGLFLALVLAVILSRRMARPVDRLVAFAGRVGAGELEARARPDGVVELDALAAAMNRMVTELERSRSDLAQKERLENELEIARRLQLSILPRDLDAPGLKIAAAMRPAGEVGGDYYDLLPAPGGCWIGVGDVAGHGLSAGVVMLMVQSIVSALARERGDARPSEVVTRLNEVLHDNIRHRLENDEHVTFSLLRFEEGGRVSFAGAHEDIVVWRAKDRRCELIATPGTWLGAVASIERHTPDSELSLSVGDVMVLYTDGVTEALSAGGELFGMERLCQAVSGAANDEPPVETIRDRVLAAVEAFSPEQRDDVTLLVIRYEAVERRA
jgi:sigma-B regulation protein RsbU (phosphoserine phosphatase)